MAQAALLSRVTTALNGIAQQRLSSTRSNAIGGSSQQLLGQRLGVVVTPQHFSSASRIVRTFALKSKAPATSKKSKSTVEDGIFGTSGGIGFTKQNELFVGRVAMIGFAASLLGEAITGKGVLAQFDLETGIPLNETEPLLLFFILFTLLGAIGALGDRGKFVDETPGPIIEPGKGFKSAIGLKEKGPVFGFTKSNELFVGRLAQLGIAFSIIGELITGKGALAQLNIETGVPITEIEPLLLFNIIFFFIAAINPGTGRFIADNEEE
ncbi:LHC-related protein [Selaginella moellendorffii]|uniref:LHC-related protein n=1 Tax=Selaginella moellendorffii TaxID=88036 RepID=D8RZJ1_SELML|nr:photosystem II 22 kDa protein, chloroplastic [Selaginella moellendorffii]EFJ22163.1 LHC-related protein [Selaginella moellendorffii]|eukprot:XP_002976494.1 photosystem II 22 kDa protein, chloroplastic [Selaginella moellendorffii]